MPLTGHPEYIKKAAHIFRRYHQVLCRHQLQWSHSRPTRERCNVSLKSSADVVARPQVHDQAVDGSRSFHFVLLDAKKAVQERLAINVVDLRFGEDSAHSIPCQAFAHFLPMIIVHQYPRPFHGLLHLPG